MHMLTYISKANMSLAKSEQSFYQERTFLERCQAYNQQHQITGFLYGTNLGFLQYIEGEEGELKSLMTKISFDNRHHSINILSSKSIESRVFNSWSLKLIREKYYLKTLLEQLHQVNILDTRLNNYSDSLLKQLINMS